ncbi:TRAFAC clade GTPase domain-containing protein [Aeoliella sp.]|uniref:TRAFAC clade GTPase domain-containing protein n=1 Tax=Aeoliella sp. TaxID=2795800 RepID=UPI003CCC34C7
MATLTRLPLDTYLLAGQAAPLECAICQHENRVSAEVCHICAAPLSIARINKEVKRPAHLIACIGAANTGKTAYLGMLMDMLMRDAGSLHTTLLGPRSISLQQATTTALAAGWYPDKTPRDPELTCWVHCRVECGRRRRRSDVAFADFSGDAFVEELEQPGSFPAIRAVLGKCSAVMVMADAQRLQAGEHDDDYIALKMLSLIDECNKKDKKKKHWVSRTKNLPLALIFAKADSTPACADDPVTFAENHASALWQDCRRRFPRTKVFAASVTGATGYKLIGGRRCRVPLRVEPAGIVEPFGWLIEQMP